ncbi:hypothetical protein [Paenibacillus harenae]|uniref:hypothetical protein n=1 Tax=Paenibacillus harenae TaxID=306543 RepID=UPI0027919808|nr:hypothetical protein [Paenibacillus harenae]MDQ0062780.1 glucan phosphoethanolaminetransferase (alkaline phosphatase superfamily) [Paenibacillus harenae]
MKGIRIIELLFSPLLHAILSICFIDLVVMETSIVVGVLFGLLMLLTNIAATTFTANGKWHFLITSTILYLLFFIGIVAFANLNGGPASLNDDGNFGAGILILVIGLPASLGTFLLGTIQGVYLSLLFKKKLHTAKRRFYAKLQE